jgi:TPR repeat protein
MALAACHDPEGIAEDALAVRDLVDIALVAEATEGHFTFTGRQGDDDCSGSVAVGPYDDEATAQIEIVCLPPPGAHTAALVANASPATVAQARRCDGGISTACTSLGLRYAKGDGIPKDLGKANMLYTQACASGDAGGCYQQAKAMDSAGAEQGSAVVALLVTACDLGDAAACGDAAQRLYNADEHDQVPTMARMARKGCDGDDRQACLVLGVLYAYGVGVPLDMDQARKRLMQACSGGLEPACDLVENL